jgi:hypothetical protein
MEIPTLKFKDSKFSYADSISISSNCLIDNHLNWLFTSLSKTPFFFKLWYLICSKENFPDSNATKM